MAQTKTNTSNTVTQAHIDSILAGSTFENTKLGSKSTVVLCVLPNGFQIIESSSCVDPANYNHDLGVQIATKRIAEKIWILEGYLMQQRMVERSLKPGDYVSVDGYGDGRLEVTSDGRDLCVVLDPSLTPGRTVQMEEAHHE